jgi:hypothetical protein
MLRPFVTAALALVVTMQFAYAHDDKPKAKTAAEKKDAAKGTAAKKEAKGKKSDHDHHERKH